MSSNMSARQLLGAVGGRDLKNLVGSAALLKTLSDLEGLGERPELVEAVGRAAKGMAGRVEAEAPQGPTGRLKKAVESGIYKRRPGKPLSGYVRMSHKKAWYAVLVEFGARGGQMPANPFFRRGVQSGQADAIAIVEAAGGKVIDDIIK